MKKQALFIAIFLLFLTFFLPALTEIDTLIGFRGYFKIGSWFPLRVSVENTEAPLFGRLEISVSSSDKYLDDSITLNYSIPIEISSNAKKTFSVNIPGFPTLSSLTIGIRKRGEPEGSYVIKKEIPLQGRGIEDNFLLVLSRGTVLDFLYSTEGFNSDGRLEIVYPHPSQLPEDWPAYNSVGTIAIHDTDLRQLTVKQIESVVSWVSSGGRIIFIGGRHFFDYMPPQFAEIMPVSLSGLVPLSENKSLDDFFGEPVSETEQILITASLYKQGRILLEEDGMPLIAVHEAGRGSVYFFAFDFTQSPFRSRRSAEIIQNYFHVTPEQKISIPLKTSQSAFENTELSVLTDIDLKTYPGLLTAALLLLPYAAAVGLSYLLFSKYKGGIKYFIIFLTGIPLICSVLILIVFAPMLSHDAGALLRLDSISGSIGNPYNHVSSNIIVSGIKQNDIAVEIGMNRQFIPASDLNVTAEIDRGNLLIRDIELQPWKGVQLQSVGMEKNELSILGGSGTPSGIRNNSDERLEDLVLISGGHLFTAGALPAGGTLRLEDMTGPGARLSPSSLRPDAFSGSKTEQQLKYNYVMLRVQEHIVKESGQPFSPLLIGWMRRESNNPVNVSYLTTAALTVLQMDVPNDIRKAVQ